jgi:hypothetical protein
VVGSLSHGDHAVFLREVIEAHLRQEIDVHPDEAILWLKVLGEKIYYGG